MRHILFTILSLILLNSFGQNINPYTREPLYDKYSPVNELAKKNRIKYIIDSNQYISPAGFRTQAFDTLGRLIGDFDCSIDSFDNPFIYQTNKDTTFRFKYNSDKTNLLSFERFVHNKKGQIVNYMDCGNYYHNNDSYYVGYEEFYYDDQDKLENQLFYFNEKYPGVISDTAIIKPVSLHLNDLIYYSYKALQNLTMLVIGKHTMGKKEMRETDSSVYNTHNQLIRFSTYQDFGYLGESAEHNIHWVTEYVYHDTSLHVTDYETHCIAPLSDYDCQSYSEPDKDIKLITYNKDGTKKAMYEFTKKSEKRVTDKYSYIHY